MKPIFLSKMVIIHSSPLIKQPPFPLEILSLFDDFNTLCWSFICFFLKWKNLSFFHYLFYLISLFKFLASFINYPHFIAALITVI